MTGLESGLLDREIVLETATKSQDPDSGEELLTWPPDGGTALTIWAQWLPAGTREAWFAQQRLKSHVDGVFRIYDMETRPTPDATRILFDGRVFDLRPYVEIGRGEGLEIPVAAHGE